MINQIIPLSCTALPPAVRENGVFSGRRPVFGITVRENGVFSGQMTIFAYYEEKPGQ